MENSQGNSLGYLLYDPYLLGYDASFFKTLGGTPSVASGKITFNAAVCGSLFFMVHGVAKLALTVPTAPTAGDARTFGFFSNGKGNLDAAYFQVDGDKFYAVTYDKDGTAESTEITWNSAWTAANCVYEIRADKNRTVFLVNGAPVADHYTSVPRKAMLPLYISNGNSDDLDLAYLEIKDARDILFAKGQAGLGTDLSGNTAVTVESDNSLPLDPLHIYSSKTGDLTVTVSNNSKAVVLTSSVLDVTALSAADFAQAEIVKTDANGFETKIPLTNLYYSSSEGILLFNDLGSNFVTSDKVSLTMPYSVAKQVNFKKIDKTNDSITTYEASCNATLVDLSTDADVVVTASPAILLGYTVDTAMSAHDVLIKDDATAKFTVPASSAAGFDRDTRNTAFATNITVQSDDAATGKIIIFWR